MRFLIKHNLKHLYSLVCGFYSSHFYAGLELRFPDVETNPGLRRPVPGACRILCSNVQILSKNLSDVTMASSQYDLLSCSEALVSDKFSSNIKSTGIQFVVQYRIDLPWCNIWRADNPVEVLNEHLSLLVGGYVPTKVIRVRNKDKPWFDDQCRYAFGLKQELIFGGPLIAFGLTGKSLFAVKWELMKPTRRPSVSLVTETGLFLWMSSPLTSGGPLLSLQCSVQFCHCLHLLMRVVDFCVSLLVRLICCRIILTASSPGRLLICSSLSPRLTSFAFRSKGVRHLLLDLDSYGYSCHKRWWIRHCN